MKLTLLKIDRILRKTQDEYWFEIPAGGIRLTQDYEFANSEPITFKLRVNGMFYDIMQNVDVDVFNEQESEPFRQLVWTRYSFLTVQEVEQTIKAALLIEELVFDDVS